MTNEEFDALRKQERDFVSENYDDVKKEIAEALQRCAEAYKKLVDSKVSYTVEYFDSKDKSIQNFTFSFSPEEFGHLTGIGKIKDIYDSSETIYQKSNGMFITRQKEYTAEDVAKSIEDSDYFFDDTIIEIPDATAPVEEKEKYEETIKELRNRNFYLKTDMLERLETLEQFSQTMDDIQLDSKSDLSFRLYNWLRDEERKNVQSLRPRGSSMSADFLLECYDSSKEKPYVDFFIIEEKNHKFSDVSIFSSKTTYSDDTPEHKATHKGYPSRKLSDNLTVLSVTKSMEQDGKPMTEEKKTSKNTYEQCQKAVQDWQNKIQNSAEAKRDSNEAKEMFKMLKTDRSCKNKKLKNEYEKALKLLPERSSSVLEILKKSLESSESSQRDEQLRNKMNQEIQLIEDILKIRELVGNLSEIKENSTEENVVKGDEVINKIEQTIEHSEKKTILCQAALQAIKQQNVTCLDETVNKLSEKLNAELKKSVEEEKTKSGEIFTSKCSNAEQHDLKINFSAGAGAIALHNTGNNPFLQLIEKIGESIRNLKESVAEKVEKVKEKLKQIFHKPNNEKNSEEAESPQAVSGSENSSEQENPKEQFHETQLPEQEFAVRVDNIINISPTELHCHSMEQYRFEGECTQPEYADKLNGIIFLNKESEKPVQEQEEEIQESQKRNDYDYDR